MKYSSKFYETEKSSFYVYRSGNIYQAFKGKNIVILVKPTKMKNGYLMFSKEGFRDYVHRIVARAFLDNINNDKYVDHIDLNKENNDVSNLSYVNNSENNLKRLPQKRLTLEQVIEIKIMLNAGLTLSEISEETGVSYKQIQYISSGYTWNYTISELIKRNRGK